MKITHEEKVSAVGLALAGISGALTNTLLVMNLIYFFFKDSYAAANGVASEAVYGFIMGIIGVNGVPEAIVAAIITVILGKTLMRKGVMERMGV